MNALVAEPAAVAARLPVSSHPAEALPEGLVLEAPYDAHGSELWDEGAIMPQSRASMLVARVLDPQPGERLLDLCAAPGGKTTHLAALTGDEARITAVERHAGRAAALRANCERLRAPLGDGGGRRGRAPAPDGPLTACWSTRRARRWAPCSPGPTPAGAPARRRLAELEARPGGDPGRRPGARCVPAACWSTRPARSPRARTSTRSPPRWSAIPSVTCDDLSRDWPLWQHPSVPSHLLTLPHRDGTDGFFIARLRRA